MSFQHRFVQGLGVKKRMHPPYLLGRILLVLGLFVFGTQAASADVSCTKTDGQWTCVCSPKLGNDGNYTYSSLNESQDKPWQSAQTAPDLDVTGMCSVPLSQPYYFRNVNIRKSGQSRSLLLFEEGSLVNSKTDFWASSIIIENGGEFYAYGDDNNNAFGFRGGVLTIRLYGKNEAEWDPNTLRFLNENQGALCKSPLGTPGPGKTPAPCGIPQATWESNGIGASKVGLPSLDAHGNQISDYFYQYGPLHGDGRCTNWVAGKPVPGSVWSVNGCPHEEVGYFGNKVLAVSYGGSLYLNGYKGATHSLPDPVCDYDPDCQPLNSGSSWMRLADGKSLNAGDTSLVLERNPNDTVSCVVHNAPFRPCWDVNDEIVVTTTDYLPGHSEKLTISRVDGTTVTFNEKIKWPHNGVRYGGPNDTAHRS